MEKKSKNTVIISELPIGKWTSNYKEQLAKIMYKRKQLVKSIEEHHTEENVNFVVKLNANLVEVHFSTSITNSNSLRKNYSSLLS